MEQSIATAHSGFASVGQVSRPKGPRSPNLDGPRLVAWLLSTGTLPCLPIVQPTTQQSTIVITYSALDHYKIMSTDRLLATLLRYLQSETHQQDTRRYCTIRTRLSLLPLQLTMIKIAGDSSISVDIAEQSSEHHLTHQPAAVCTSIMATPKYSDVFVDLHESVSFGCYQIP